MRACSSGAAGMFCAWQGKASKARDTTAFVRGLMLQPRAVGRLQAYWFLEGLPVVDVRFPVSQREGHPVRIFALHDPEAGVLVLAALRAGHVQLSPPFRRTDRKGC